MAAARAGRVMGVVTGQTSKEPVGVDFHRAATGPDVLVVVFLAGGQVLAEPASLGSGPDRLCLRRPAAVPGTD